MSHALLDLVRDLMTSPWIYLVLFGFAALDGFFPVVPSESLVITAGVFAARGDPSLYGVIAAAALGAVVGDHTSYLLGRLAGTRLPARLRPGTRRYSLFAWAKRSLDERGGLLLVVARYVPGGRTATTVTMGAVGYRQRSFSFFAAIAAVSWGVYSGLVGYLGGWAFENDPLKGLLLGLGLALAVTAIVEYARHQHRRRNAVAIPPAPDLPSSATGTLEGVR